MLCLFVRVKLSACSSLDAVRLGSSGAGHILKEPWSKKIHDKLIFLKLASVFGEEAETAVLHLDRKSVPEPGSPL